MDPQPIGMSFEALTEEAPFTPEQEAAVREIALARAASDLARIVSTLSDSEAFAHLPRAAAAAFHLERFTEARALAERSLSLAPSFRGNWNYGNAIHIGHTILGLLALEQDDIERAINELILSGDTPGSPQLGSFGPTMQLAKALLKRGQVNEVLSYLRLCREFWEMGTTWLDVWEPKVVAGQVPNFFQHGYA
jgi:tetratricopeptide (TPR) repeat protein